MKEKSSGTDVRNCMAFHGQGMGRVSIAVETSGDLQE